MQAKYFRISALVLELRMLIFFRSEKKRVNESAIRLSGTLDCLLRHSSTDSLDSAEKRDFSAFSDFINNLNVYGILGI